MQKRIKTVVIFMLTAMLLFSAAGEAYAFGKGAQGPDVYAVQGMLKSIGYYSGPITGYYGSLTETGVKSFQKAYGLPETGAVDAKTLQSILWAYSKIKIPAPTPATSPAQQKLPSLSQEEQQMVNLINSERKKQGLPALQADLELSRVARIKSQDMVAHNYFSHESPTYGSPFTMLNNFGISYTSAGENIACNASVQAAHQAFMNSEGHRANILSKSYTRVGVGIVSGGPCGMMFTEQFIGK